MATDPSPQRAYRAACPNCGAAVEFRSAASALAVCSYCRSTLLREGDALRRIGQSAELFDDHSPLQLGTAGRWQGAAFTLVGRLQVRYAGGSWNEWHALFDSADPTDAAPRSGWLSEDNGGYVFGFEAPAPPEALPPPEALRVGAQQVLGRESWSVASVTTARLGAAEGELPFVPMLERAYVVAELRNARGEVASIDYGPASEGRPPRWYVGRGLQLAELTLSGLREDGSTRDLKGRTLACPSCGASVAVQLDSTQSIVCAQCHAVVDLGAPGAQGAGADLKHYAQDTPGATGGEPLIALGRSGTLTLGAGGPLPWQVVGYVERCTLPEAGDDEQSFWREYLLYNRQAGFAFLVDAEDGWSWVRPLTGAPQVSGATARWQGDSYRELYRYSGQITYVLGEFYWRLARGERTRNTDYRGPGGKQLNREQTGEGGDAEVTWSAGAALDADVLFKAFKLDDGQRAALQRDAKPVSTKGFGGMAGLFLFLLFVVVVFSMVRCGRDDCSELRRTYGEASNEYQSCARNSGSGVRSSGGSYGGFSTGGGGHK
ncbi:DUF4178 domain-containing protein [Methylibium petroleiphilum]|uniref:DUF4178 domain-containing protein n=1 Tax=Methylibium petroleiphilum (strain ATCC BAA-1232 / LMG 22953 / PM1) TaxID=420662 RepID=A2SCC0_METPP|nr:DUF4178 domain-containing protein [Methylibium petroleiphilum]ABM93209.1 hypothetical protein Mpe_A0247 [Methylibium petroleiphilum PM1]